MSEKLYYTQSELFEWNTEITDVRNDDGKWIVNLKETAFYPEGGGQPCDLGYIDEIKVLDVYKNDDEQVFHVLENKPVNRTVHCKIDRKRRIEHSQHHSGQHLLSAICLELFGYETVSFHLGKDFATIDLNTPELTIEQIEKIESRVNEEIFNNRPIRTFYIHHSEVKKYNLRKIPSGHETLRIVEIEGIEFNACGGTHLQSTAQIGQLKLLKQEKVRGNVRLQFVCGARLFNDYKEKLNIVSTLSQKYTTAPDRLEEKFEKAKKDIKELTHKYNVLFDTYSNLLTTELLKTNELVIKKTFDQWNIKELTVLAAKLIKETDRLIVLGSLVDKRALITHSGKNEIHCGNFVKENVGRFSGKGGGSNKNAQASFPSETDLKNFIDLF